MKKDSINQLAVRLPLVAAVVGMAVVLSSVVFFFVEDDIRRILAVSAGLFLLLIGIWFAANPYVVNTRHFVPLRVETDRFLSLVRELNAAACEGAHERMDETKAKMQESLDRMMDVAGVESDRADPIPGP